MQAIHQAVLNRITTLANSIGAEFAVMIDGEVHGPLASRVDIPAPKGPRRRVVVYNFVRDTGYNGILPKLEAGGVYERTVEGGDYADHFVDTLRAWANKNWGKDKFILATEARDEGRKIHVQLLRVE